jgi:hypothetical protein
MGRGKYVAKYIESLLRKCVIEYVTFQLCRSPNTDLVIEQGSRLYFYNCRDCGSKSGYHARAMLTAPRKGMRMAHTVRLSEQRSELIARGCNELVTK